MTNLDSLQELKIRLWIAMISSGILESELKKRRILNLSGEEIK